MESKKLAFVTIEPRNKTFTAFLSVDALLSMEKDPEPILRKAAELYEEAIRAMRSLVSEIQVYKERRIPIPARIMWKLGDSVFQLKNDLEKLSIQLDSIYLHLVRDLGVKREWLEKVVIFRRYLPKENLIPESLSWSFCSKEIRRTAERLRGGLSIN